MTRSSLLIAIATTAAGCNAIVGVGPLAIDDAGISSDASPTVDAVADSTESESSDGATDATLEPDAGRGDVATQDAIPDATYTAAPDAGDARALDGEADGGTDGEPSAGDGGTDGGAAPDADAGPPVDAAEASTTPDEASTSDDGGAGDGASEDGAD
jgi:hypothetical protein